MYDYILQNLLDLRNSKEKNIIINLSNIQKELDMKFEQLEVLLDEQQKIHKIISQIGIPKLPFIIKDEYSQYYCVVNKIKTISEELLQLEEILDKEKQNLLINHQEKRKLEILKTDYINKKKKFLQKIEEKHNEEIYNIRYLNQLKENKFF